MDTYSYSRLNLFTRCPAAWHMKYVDGLVEQASPAATRGSQCHEFAEAYAKHCRETNARTDWDWGRVQLASYPEAVRETCKAWMAQTVWDWSLVVASGEGVEREFETALPDDLGTLRGRVDLVQWNNAEEALWVTDYKSGFGPREKPDECPPQLRCYAWAMREEFGAARLVVARYLYMASGMVHEWELYEPTPAWAVSIIRRIEAETDFRPTPSASACQYCGYTKQCPLVNADPTAHPTNDDEARRLCEVTWATQARVAALKSALKDFTADRDPLEYGGAQVAGKFPPKSNKPKATLAKDIDLFAFVAAAQAAAIPLGDLLKLDEVKLAKLLHDDYSAYEDDPAPFDDADEDTPELAAVKAMLTDKAASNRRTFRLDDAPADAGTDEGEEA